MRDSTPEGDQGGEGSLLGHPVTHQLDLPFTVHCGAQRKGGALRRCPKKVEVGSGRIGARLGAWACSELKCDLDSASRIGQAGRRSVPSAPPAECIAPLRTLRHAGAMEKRSCERVGARLGAGVGRGGSAPLTSHARMHQAGGGDTRARERRVGGGGFALLTSTPLLTSGSDGERGCELGA